MILGKQGPRLLLTVVLPAVATLIVVARADIPTVNYQYDKLGNLVSAQSCMLTTCLAQAKNCGTIADGCGGTLSCGSCSVDQVCTAANVCCLPIWYCSAGTCGTVSNGCGGTLQCPGCPLYYSCVANRCVVSSPGTCSGRCDGSCSEAITDNCTPGFSPSYGFFCDVDYRGRCRAYGSTACTCQ